MQNGAWNRARMLLGLTCDESPSTQKISPPRRATVSCEPSSVCRRPATATSSMSPNWWPSASLVSAKWSRSTSDKVASSRAGPARVASRISTRRVRLGSFDNWS
ncbi:hypothetical protein D3C72_2161090 [compost metagenome]